jgi:hypothetical protein
MNVYSGSIAGFHLTDGEKCRPQALVAPFRHEKLAQIQYVKDDMRTGQNDSPKTLPPAPADLTMTHGEPQPISTARSRWNTAVIVGL